MYTVRGLGLVASSLVLSCGSSCSQDGQEGLPEPVDLPARATYMPQDGSVLFLVGQDLDSVRAYTGSGCCRTPAGTTTYIGMYTLLSEAQSFGGLGVNASGEPTGTTVDWGGGASNLVMAAQEAEPGILAVGLDMTENNHPGALARLGAGAYDREIDHLAATLKGLSNPVLLRIGYEFDGNWNAGYGVAENYVRAYRRIVERIVAAGASNVAFVWQSSTSIVDDVVDGRREDITDWYPGDAYVDWIGLSWFIDIGVEATVGGERVVAQELMDELLGLARERDKPVMIAEASPQGYDLKGGSRSQIANLIPGQVGLNGPPGTIIDADLTGEALWEAWFAPFFAFIEDNRDRIRAVAYINAHWDAQALWAPPYASGYWGDSRVQENPVVLERWNEVFAEPYWRHGGPDLYEAIGAGNGR